MNQNISVFHPLLGAQSHEESHKSQTAVKPRDCRQTPGHVIAFVDDCGCICTVMAFPAPGAMSSPS